MNLVLKAIMADGTEVTASRFSLLSSRSAVTSLPSPPRRSACRSLTSLPLSLRVRPVGSLPSRCAASVTRGGMRPGEERERRVSDSPRRVTVTGPIQPLLPSALRSSSSSLPRLLLPYGLSSLHSSFPSGRKHNRGNEVMRVTKSRENDGWARAPVPVTHILTLSGRSLQSQPFHRESFYVTGTRVPFSSCRVSTGSLGFLSTLVPLSLATIGSRREPSPSGEDDRRE